MWQKIIQKSETVFRGDLSSEELIPTRFLVGLVSVLFIAIIFINSVLQEKFYPDPQSSIFDNILLSLAFIIAGFIGIIYIVRKEIPFIIPIKGGFAVLLGFILTITSWSIALYSIWFAFQ